MRIALPRRTAILIVDDDPAVLDALAGGLRAAGMLDVRTACGAERALAALEEAPADILLIDWVMRPVSGRQLLRQARRRAGPELPVVVLTGHADAGTVRAAWSAGADAILVKPTPVAAILQRIRDVLQRPRRPPVEPPVRRETAPPPLALPPPG